MPNSAMYLNDNHEFKRNVHYTLRHTKCDASVGFCAALPHSHEKEAWSGNCGAVCGDMMRRRKLSPGE